MYQFNGIIITKLLNKQLWWAIITRNDELWLSFNLTAEHTHTGSEKEKKTRNCSYWIVGKNMWSHIKRVTYHLWLRWHQPNKYYTTSTIDRVGLSHGFLESVVVVVVGLFRWTQEILNKQIEIILVNFLLRYLAMAKLAFRRRDWMNDKNQFAYVNVYFVDRIKDKRQFFSLLASNIIIVGMNSLFGKQYLHKR